MAHIKFAQSVFKTDVESYTNTLYNNVLSTLMI